MVGHRGGSAGSYLADPTSPIPSHCASIVATCTLRVKFHQALSYFWLFSLLKVTGCSVHMFLLCYSSYQNVFAVFFWPFSELTLTVLVQRWVNFDQLDMNFWKLNIFWASNKQTMYRNWFFYFWRLRLRSPILELWCDEDVMINYNNDNNAYCRAVNAQKFEIIEHNTV